MVDRTRHTPQPAPASEPADPAAALIGEADEDLGLYLDETEDDDLFDNLDLENMPTEVLQGIISGVADGLIDALGEAEHRFDAELAVSSVFGVIGEGLSQDTDDLERAHAPVALVGHLSDHCESHPSPATLELLLLLADQGPQAGRALAEAAAQRLKAQAIALPKWATGGSPEVTAAWRCGDDEGEQTSLGVRFSDAGAEHTLMVLIDGARGGGLRDAWFAAGDDAHELPARAAAQVAQEEGTYFEELTERQALEYLRPAFAAEPCPGDPDQFEDIDTFLFLAHTRARQMAERLGEPPVQLFADHADLDVSEQGLPG